MATLLAAATAVTAVAAPRLGRLSLADLGLALAVVLLWRELRSSSLPHPVDWAVASWLLISVLAGGAALVRALPERPEMILFTIGRRVEFAVALVLGRAASRAGGRDLLRGALLAGAAVVAIYGIGQHFFPGQVLGAFSGEQQPRSFERGLFLGEANHVAGVFALALALALPWAAEGPAGPRRRLGIAAFVLAAAGLITTGSRTGLAAAAAGVWTAALVSGRRALALAVSASALVVVALPGAFAGRLVALVRSLGGAAAGGGALGDRAWNWFAAREAILAYPLLGVGPGTRAMSFYDSALLLAVEGAGALGALSFALLLAVLWLSIRGRDNPGETGAMVTMVILGAGMVSFHLVRTGLPFALVAGATLVGSTPAPGQEGSNPRPLRR